MRKVWIPESMYRCFPWISMATGAIFYGFMQGVVGIGLCVLLIGYGFLTSAARAVRRW